MASQESTTKDVKMLQYCKSVGLVAPITINVENDSYQYVSILDSLCA